MIKLFYDKTMSFFENLCRLLLCEESENGSEGNLAAITGIPAGISGMCFLSDTEKTAELIRNISVILNRDNGSGLKRREECKWYEKRKREISIR